MSSIQKKLKLREEEASGILQYWVNAINSYGCNDGGAFDYNRFDSTLKTLEGMLLIYNAFADSHLELVDQGETHVYELMDFS